VDVYGTARGPLARLAGPPAARARARRHQLFLDLARVTPATRIVDIGCGALGLRALAPELDITGVDVVPRPDYPGPFVRADATQPLPFDDDGFDLAYSNSVIEHLPRDRRAAYADEIKRVARGHWVQTPAFSFPLEPHALLPFAQFLPKPLRRAYWQLGAAGTWEPDLALMRRRELIRLFGEPVVAERVGPLAKSWIAVRAPGPQAG
jgi:SAM-dependent methyltransferase